MQNDKIVIELGDPNPPVKVNFKNSPTSGNFVLTPKHQPELSGRIDKIAWKSVAQTLNIRVQETADLDVFKWIEYIQNREKEIKEGPFVDLNEDALQLDICDGSNRPVGRLRFKNLSLNCHHCNFDNQETGALCHYLEIHYQEVEKVETVSDDKIDVEKVVDEEWQTVNGP